MAAHSKKKLHAPDIAPSGDERSWWTSKDQVEPLMGVPAVSAGMVPVPLPDNRPDAPEPGVAPEQEDATEKAELQPRPWETPES